MLDSDTKNMISVWIGTSNNSPRMFSISELYLESLLNLLCNEGKNDD